MRVSVTLTDLSSSESRSQTIEFKTYAELRELIDEFENESPFKRLDCSIEDLSDDCDRETLDSIELGD